MDRFLVAIFLALSVASPARAGMRYAKIGPAHLEQAWSVLGNPVVQAISHDRYTRELLAEDLESERSRFFAIRDGDAAGIESDDGPVIGISQAYSTRPGVYERPVVQELIRSQGSRDRFVGIGLHFLPEYTGQGRSTPALDHLIAAIFDDPRAGVIWGAAHRDNALSNRTMVRLTGAPLVRAGERNDYNYYFLTYEQWRASNFKSTK